TLNECGIEIDEVPVAASKFERAAGEIELADDECIVECRLPDATADRTNVVVGWSEAKRAALQHDLIVNVLVDERTGVIPVEHQAGEVSGTWVGDQLSAGALNETRRGAAAGHQENLTATTEGHCPLVVQG